MNRRDVQLLKKIIQEIDIATNLIKGKSLENFIEDEMLKRAICIQLILVNCS